MQYAVQPLVKSGLLPGQTSPKDYRLGVEYTYSTVFPGQVEYEKHFLCDSYTDCSGGPVIVNRVDQTWTEQEYYTSGAAVGLLYRTIVDQGTGTLNLTTEYQYDSYRHPTGTTVDPGGLTLTTQYSLLALGQPVDHHQFRRVLHREHLQHGRPAGGD